MPAWLRPGRVISFVLVNIWLLIVLIPLYYMLLSSFRSV